ncbi:MAG: surface protein, partial [Segetibacter sp.]|nr:surface protein [Segetibacter sp.]
AVYQNANFRYRFRGDMATYDANNFYVFIDDIEINSCTPAASSIGNFVWNDKNGNGIQESTEPGIAGAVVKLTKTGGTTTTTTTNNSGAYNFDNLSAGTYVVNFVTPLGFVPAPANQGTNDAIDSDPVNTNVSVTLADNQNIATVDAGFTAHTYCKNSCTHSCNHSNCGVNHSSCVNKCSHTTCGHSNCGYHLTCRNDCNHTNCGHTKCGSITTSMRSSEPVVAASSATLSFNPSQSFGGINGKPEMKVYPNPSSGVFNVRLSNIKVKQVTVMIVDEIGVLVAQKPVVVTPGQTQIVNFNLTNKAPGMYFIKVFSDYSAILTDKVIIVN